MPYTGARSILETVAINHIALYTLTTMRDCYEVLGVPRTASAAEIRRAYRKKAKLLHPDVTHSQEDAGAFRELVQAYETLTDARSRGIFDDSTAFRAETWHYKKRTVKKFDYREWLLARSDDESRAKLIFFDLMHHREDDAVNEYKRMNMTHVDFKMYKWFIREDFMDYGFILAEELVLRREFYDAVLLPCQVIQMNYEYDYFRLFFPEVLDFMRHILRHNIEGNVNDELAIDAWERALELRLGKSDDIFMLNKMAGAYDRIGDSYTASLCREAASKVGVA